MEVEILEKFYMNLAIELAKKGRGRVSPNPLVGAVIVKRQKIIGQGYHEEFGKSHAEVNAIDSSSESVEGSSIYVTLEPCSYYGKTPPCVDKIIECKIAKVIIGTLDPNPLVAGKGIEKLRKAGIEVIVGVLEKECMQINEIFMKYIVEKIPFVIMKSAMSLDGKIATKTGESKWITSESARIKVHELRNEVSSIMIGIQTVIVDNPRLSCRIENTSNPIRIVVDSSLRIPIESNIVQSANEISTIVATTKNSDSMKINELEKLGVRVMIIPEKDNRVDLKILMKELGKLKIDSILLEGGATLNYSALESNIIDKVQMYIAPKIIGGNTSKTPVGGSGIDFLKNAYNIEDLKFELVGKDILIEGYIKSD